MKLLFWCVFLAVVVIGCSGVRTRNKQVFKEKRILSAVAEIPGFTAQLTSAINLNGLTSLLLDDVLGSALTILGGAANVLAGTTQIVGGVLSTVTGLLEIVTAGVFFVTMAVQALAAVGLELLVNGNVVASITGSVLNTILTLDVGDVLSLNLNILGGLDILGVGSILSSVAGNLLFQGLSLSGFMIGGGAGR